MLNIRFFGKIRIVHVYGKKIKAKLANRGIHCMFIGYSKDNKDDVYRMLNMQTLKVKTLKTYCGSRKAMESGRVLKRIRSPKS